MFVGTGVSIGRLTQCVVRRQATSWVVLLADDLHLDMGGPNFRSALLVFFLQCAVSGCPLSWSLRVARHLPGWVSNCPKSTP